MFLLGIIYGFTILTYWQASSDYSDQMCNSLFTCLIINFDQAFKNDGGLGGYLDPAYGDGEITSPKRIIFDNIFNFIVLILIVELLAGIIIDTFSEMRDENKQRMFELNNECFVCG